ncbi:hypothetical protein [Massilia sp. CF038]|uniref:hypothetical protein n=1 Tax=Massilia sp. CF038 TaxID=1881045 RepID=UPI00091B5D69|nr:hypothetical protein [Massilia sp. CF038]SHG48543.1 hypothetical protein SAMN05428948_0682 [Massilia sp. CF038]
MAARERSVHHAGELLRALTETQAAVNASLRDHAMARLRAPSSDAPGFLRYRDNAPPHRSHAIALHEFARQSAWCIEHLALNVDGYCVQRRFGWERRLEWVLSTRRPAWWRRLARPAPLLTLTMHAGPGATNLVPASPDTPPPRGGHTLIVRLAPALQHQLEQIHAHACALAPTRAQRLWAWLRGAKRASSAASETDI